MTGSVWSGGVVVVAAMLTACGPLVPIDGSSSQSGSEGAGTTDPGAETSGRPPVGSTLSASGAGVTTNPIDASSSSSSGDSSGESSSSTTGQPVTASGVGTGDSQGQPTSGGQGSDSAGCGFVPGDPECGDCLAAECCGAVSTCLADPDCGCILGCFDQLTPAGLLPCLTTCASGSIPPDLAPVVECASEVCPVCL